jgi:cell shape-determining protein MreC
MLKGIGFNYDYPDSMGPPSQVPLLKEGDLLVTSGLDGVFPPGIPVGLVTWIKPAKGSSYALEMEARPIVKNLNDLQAVVILPPRSE